MFDRTPLIFLFFCIAIVPFTGHAQERDLHKLFQTFKEAMVPIIDKGFEQSLQYPQIPGIFIASVLRAGKQAVTQKPASFIIWGLFGSTIAAEGFKIAAGNYLQMQKIAQTEGSRRIKEHWLEDLKGAKETAKQASKEAAAEVLKPESY